jgi:hypothetical protein
MSGRGNLTAVVYHSPEVVPGTQSLKVQFWQFDAKMTMLYDGPLCLSPNSTLKWAYINDQGVLVTMDSTGMIRVLLGTMNWAWMNLCNAKTMPSLIDEKEMFIWPISYRNHQLLYVPLFNKQPHPQVSIERPLPRSVTLTMPMLALRDGTSRTAMAVEAATRERLLHNEARFMQTAPRMDAKRAKVHDLAYMALAIVSAQDGNLLRALDAATFIEQSEQLKMCIEKLNSMAGTDDIVDQLASLLQSRGVSTDLTQDVTLADKLESTPHKPTTSSRVDIMASASKPIEKDPFMNIDNRVPATAKAAVSTETARVAKKSSTSKMMNPFAK